MKLTAIVRTVTSCGRVVIPKEIRDMHKLVEGTPLEVFVEDETVILKPFRTKCAFCDDEENLTRYKENLICNNCANAIIKLITK